MQNVLPPMIAGAYREEGPQGVRNAVRRLDRVLIAGAFAMGVVVLIFGPGAAHLLFKSVPGNARTLLLLLSLNLVAYAGTLAQSYGLAALGRADKSFYSSAVGFAVQVPACVYMVRHFEVAGAAASLLLGNLVLYLTRLCFYSKDREQTLWVDTEPFDGVSTVQPG